MRFVFGGYTLDTERYELRWAGQVVALEPRAFGSWYTSCSMPDGRCPSRPWCKHAGRVRHQRQSPRSTPCAIV